jgi:hypothetical protein
VHPRNWQRLSSQGERNLHAISVKDNHAPVHKLLARNILISKLARKSERYVKVQGCQTLGLLVYFLHTPSIGTLRPLAS